MGRAVVSLLVWLPASLLTGCRADGLAFVQDRSLSIVSPRSEATVALPLVVRWRLNGKKPPGASFAVLVDRTPPPPRKSLRWLALNDPSCRGTFGCPQPSWYAQNGIHRTPNTSLRIDLLGDTRGGRRGSRDRHRVEVVLLDGAGRRHGESFASVEFIVERRDGAGAA